MKNEEKGNIFLKKFINNNIKLLVAFILGGIFVGSSVYVIATTYYSNNVLYNNANSTLTATNVQDALDELYTKSVGPIITSVIDNENLTAIVNITVTVNPVASVCVNTTAKRTDDCTWKSVSGTSFITNAVASAGSYYIHVQDTGGRISHSSSVSLTVHVVYTLFDTVTINSSITGKTTYETPQLAMNPWKNYYSNGKSYYLKHILDGSNIVKESYVGFVVTNAMANTYSGMVVGTYYLRGGDGGTSFVDNAKIIYDAFTTRCSSNPYTTTPTSAFTCSVSGLIVYASATGYIYAMDGDGATCYVFSGSYSYCTIGGSG